MLSATLIALSVVAGQALAAQNIGRRMHHVNNFPSFFLKIIAIVAPKAYISLPLGVIKPSGWLYNQVGLNSILSQVIVLNHVCKVNSADGRTCWP